MFIILQLVRFTGLSNETIVLPSPKSRRSEARVHIHTLRSHHSPNWLTSFLLGADHQDVSLSVLTLISFSKCIVHRYNLNGLIKMEIPKSPPQRGCPSRLGVDPRESAFYQTLPADSDASAYKNTTGDLH